MMILLKDLTFALHQKPDPLMQPVFKPAAAGLQDNDTDYVTANSK